jgi:hypothetical protein
MFRQVLHRRIVVYYFLQYLWTTSLVAYVDPILLRLLFNLPYRLVSKGNIALAGCIVSIEIHRLPLAIC